MHLISHIILTIIMRADISDEDISAIVLEEGMLPQFVGRFIIVFLQGWLLRTYNLTHSMAQNDLF